MKRLIKFNRTYFIFALLLFIIEIIIAKFVDDQFIRPYVGDVLVVILIYCFVKSFLSTPVLPTGICVLIFAFLIETLQYINIVKRLGLQQSSLAKTVMGTSFEWADLLAYTIGIIIVLFVEKSRFPKRTVFY